MITMILPRLDLTAPISTEDTPSLAVGVKKNNKKTVEWKLRLEVTCFGASGFCLKRIEYVWSSHLVS